MGGIFGLGGSAVKTDRNAQLGSWGTLSGVSDFATNAGEKNLGAGSGYYQSILSGDPSKVAEAIAPQTKAIKDQAQQEKQTLAQFSNRGGGTNAASQQIDTNTQSAVQNLINTLIPQAATNLETVGGQELNTGTQAAGQLGSLTQEARTADQAQANAMGGGIASLVGGSIGSIAQGLSGGGGFGDVISSLAGMFI